MSEGSSLEGLDTARRPPAFKLDRAYARRFGQGAVPSKVLPEPRRRSRTLLAQTPRALLAPDTILARPYSARQFNRRPEEPSNT